MAPFIGCQAECVDLALTSGASNNYENMMGVIFNSARCVFKCMKLLVFLAGCCSAWCHCALCVNGSSVGGGLITQAPFVCSPPGLQCQRMNLETRTGDKLM